MDQTDITPQGIIAKVDEFAKVVQTSLQNSDPTNNFGLYTGLSQWYEDLEKNVLGRLHQNTYYLHQLYKALLKEIFNLGTAAGVDTTAAQAAWQTFYNEFVTLTTGVTTFDETQPQTLGAINTILNPDYE